MYQMCFKPIKALDSVKEILNFGTGGTGEASGTGSCTGKGMMPLAGL